MQRRKQSVVTLSFSHERDPQRGYFSRVEPTRDQPEPESPFRDHSGKSGKPGNPGKELMDLCREIAGALLCRHASGEDAGTTRSLIRKGLMEKIECERTMADSLIDLALELIHVQSYGKYRRNPLELAILIARAAGQRPEEPLN